MSPAVGGGAPSHASWSGRRRALAGRSGAESVIARAKALSLRSPWRSLPRRVPGYGCGAARLGSAPGCVSGRQGARNGTVRRVSCLARPHAAPARLQPRCDFGRAAQPRCGCARSLQAQVVPAAARRTSWAAPAVLHPRSAPLPCCAAPTRRCASPRRGAMRGVSRAPPAPRSKRIAAAASPDCTKPQRASPQGGVNPAACPLRARSGGSSPQCARGGAFRAAGDELAAARGTAVARMWQQLSPRRCCSCQRLLAPRSRSPAPRSAVPLRRSAPRSVTCTSR